MAEHVVIVGGGIAGMCSALALAKRGFDITLLERDCAPPAGDADKAFFEWKRRGASQFRHPHAFLGLMCNLLQDNYPDLLQDFYDAGARKAPFTEMLPPKLQAKYKPEPGDEKLFVLMCRRATIETVLRRYIEKLPRIRILNDAIITGMISQQREGQLYVTGVKLRDDSAEKCGAEICGDVVVDASGRTSKFPNWFADLGRAVPTEKQDAEIVYYTRHYKLKEGVQEPSRNGPDRAGGDLGYLKFGIFPGDKGHFALIMCLHQDEKDLIDAITDGEKFDHLLRTIPGLKPWLDENASEATTHSFGHADIKAQWRHYVTDGQPIACNFFAVGDAAIRTNPLYGRGCSTGILHAHLLADVLTAKQDAKARALLFDQRAESELRPIYTTSLTQDRDAIRRAKAIMNDVRERPKKLKARIALSFGAALIAAMQENLHVFRGVMRTTNLLEKPGTFLKDWRVRLIILRYMLRGRKKNASALFQRGPSRNEMLSLARQL